MIWIFIAIVVPYVLILYILRYGFQESIAFSLRKLPATTKFSVVVAFRNEAKNLPSLLASIQQLKYPESYFEVLFVNDASKDASEEIIHETLKKTTIQYKIIQNSLEKGSPKKRAITKAITASQYAWIVTTDADCTVPTYWLQILNDYLQEAQPVCVAMPVDYQVDNTFLQRYQQLDNWSLQAVTIGSYGNNNLLLSNGANFSYQKAAFEQVHGFEGNLHIASGDDMFLLEKFKEVFPKRIGYIKSRHAIVVTTAVSSWKALVNQRLRWASKTSNQKSTLTKFMGAIVFLTSIFILIFPLVLLLNPWAYSLTVMLLIAKIGVDFFLLHRSADFFEKKLTIFTFLVSVFVNAAITVWVVFCSLFKSFSWKQRTFKA